MKIHRQYCLDRAPAVQTYAQGFWGLNASDGPDGYAALRRTRWSRGRHGVADRRNLVDNV